MNTTIPLLKATRAALTELTTSEAQLWYRDRAKATAAGVKAIAHKSIATVTRLLKPQSVAEPEQAIAPHHPKSAFTEAAELAQWPIPNGWDVIEADDDDLEQANDTDSGSDLPTPEQGSKSFPNLRIGNSLEEQIQLNQPAMRLLEQLIHKSPNEPTVDSVDELDNFQKIIDGHRPIGQKVFSASESDVNQ